MDEVVADWNLLALSQSLHHEDEHVIRQFGRPLPVPQVRETVHKTRDGVEEEAGLEKHLVKHDDDHPISRIQQLGFPLHDCDGSVMDARLDGDLLQKAFQRFDGGEAKVRTQEFMHSWSSLDEAQR